MHENPTLSEANGLRCIIKISSQKEKPRYVKLDFQTNRKNKLDKDMSICCALTTVL